MIAAWFAGKIALLEYRLAKAGYRRLAHILGWNSRRKVEN